MKENTESSGIHVETDAHDESVSRRAGQDDMIIAALAAGPSYAKAGEIANVSGPTVARRKTDPAFAQRVADRRGEQVVSLAGQSTSLAGGTFVEGGEGAPLLPSIASRQIGDRVVPIMQVARCQVCNCPWRWLIEATVVLGVTYAGTARTLGHLGFSVSSLSNHFRRGHVPGFEPARGRHKFSPSHVIRLFAIVGLAAARQDRA